MTTTSYSVTLTLPWQLDLANAWLMELTYRPGWSFELRDGGCNRTGGNSAWCPPGLHLIVKAMVPDSNDPAGPEIALNHNLPIDPAFLADQERLYRAVLQAVIMIETHEAMEYLRAAGARVCSPHPSPGVALYSPTQGEP